MIKILALSDNYRSIKADLYNIEETSERPCRPKRLAFSLQSNLRYEYEKNMFSSLPIHSISQNYGLDLLSLQHDPRAQQMSCHIILISHYARQRYELGITGFSCSL